MIQELPTVIRSLNGNFESHYKLIESSFSFSEFGDSIAVYERGDLQLRFVRDRGELDCDFRAKSSKENWMSIYERFSELPRSRRQSDESQALLALLKLIDQSYEHILRFASESP